MSKHPFTDDFSELLSTLSTEQSEYEQADALYLMGSHLDCDQVIRGSALEDALGRMMDVFEPVISEEVEEGDYYLSSWSDDVMFSFDAVRYYLRFAASNNIATIAQSVWGIDFKPNEFEEYATYCARLLPVFIAQVEKNQIADAVSVATEVARSAKNRAM